MALSAEDPLGGVPVIVLAASGTPLLHPPRAGGLASDGCPGGGGPSTRVSTVSFLKPVPYMGAIQKSRVLGKAPSPWSSCVLRKRVRPYRENKHRALQRVGKALSAWEMCCAEYPFFDTDELPYSMRKRCPREAN
jgi:hypothetical protein